MGYLNAESLTVREMVAHAHKNSQDKGFWEGNQNIPEKLALIHSEVSEALEEYRVNPDKLSVLSFEENGKPVGFASELADVIIRIADLSGFLGVDLEEIIKKKMAYNATRSHRHGGKAC